VWPTLDGVLDELCFEEMRFDLSGLNYAVVPTTTVGKHEGFYSAKAC